MNAAYGQVFEKTIGSFAKKARLHQWAKHGRIAANKAFREAQNVTNSADRDRRAS